MATPLCEATMVSLMHLACDDESSMANVWNQSYVHLGGFMMFRDWFAI